MRLCAARTLLFRLIINKTGRCAPPHRSFAVLLFIALCVYHEETLQKFTCSSRYVAPGNRTQKLSTKLHMPGISQFSSPLHFVLYYASDSWGGGGVRSRQRGKKKELFSFEEEGIDILLYK
jgi:hypothetical protein